jgi:hypothetical protein
MNMAFLLFYFFLRSYFGLLFFMATTFVMFRAATFILRTAAAETEKLLEEITHRFYLN